MYHLDESERQYLLETQEDIKAYMKKPRTPQNVHDMFALLEIEKHIVKRKEYDVHEEPSAMPMKSNPY